MSTDRETTRIVRSWLDEGVTELPDRVLDAVLDQLPATHQRRATWWPARRSSAMNTTAKFALAAAAAVLVAVVGLTVANDGIGGGPGPTDPTPSPTVGPTLTSTPEARTLPEGGSLAGDYLVSDPRYTPVTVGFTVPEGWASKDGGAIVKNRDTSAEVAMNLDAVTHVFDDACASEGTLTEIGPSAADLVDALLAQSNTLAAGPVDLMIGGHPAQRVDIAIPEGLDQSRCAIQFGLQVWEVQGVGYFVVPTATTQSVYVLEVDGERVVITAGGGPAATPEDLAELDAIIDSVTFPLGAAALPSLSLPGPRGGPAGEYGWEGRSGGRIVTMHRTVDHRGETTVMGFAVGPDCLEPSEDQAPVPVRVAGLAGVSVEPYEPTVTFNRSGQEITRAHALSIAGRTLCVYVTWHPTTTDGERQSAMAILASLRAQPVGVDGVRVTFILPDGWDTG